MTRDLSRRETAADHSAWNKAVDRLRAVEAEYSRIEPRYSETYEVADAACPRQDEFFSRYHLGVGWERERNFRAARMSLVIERARGRNLTDDEVKQVTADAYRVVDEFETWCARHDEAFAEHDAWEERFNTVVGERSDARKALLTTEAPDREALLFKIELLSEILDELDDEDAESLSAIRKDARRLLART